MLDRRSQKSEYARHRYFVIYKPYNFLSQFSREVPEHQTLEDLYDFPKDVYPVGRLDRDSEGLLILTNDRSLTDRLLNPKNKHRRTYWAQVEGIPTSEALQQLQNGVEIRINKKNYFTQPAKAQLIVPAPNISERTPPIRFRANIPTAWLELILTEGKNRQVRRMCAKVGFPVLRLLRVSIGKLELGTMNVGEVREMNRKELYAMLF